LVLDAAYAEYVERADYDPGISLVDAGNNTVMTRTFSKMFGLGGARLGWAYAPEPVIDVLNRSRMPFNVSGPAAAAGIAALAEPGWIAKCRRHNTQARAFLSEKLIRAGLVVHPSEANFVLVDFGDAATATRADHHARQRGIIVRRVEAYGLPQCLRVTIGTDDECNAIADALIEFAGTHG
jgi:histidinol-phosphate aminotransferase